MESERVCSHEEARELLDDLKAAWGELTKAEKWELRGELHKVAEE